MFYCSRLNKNKLSKEEKRKILDSISSTLNFRTLNDWNNLKSRQFEKLGGKVILNDYNCITDMLQDVYPDKDIDLYSFSSHKLPNGFWECKKNQIVLLERISSILDIKEPSDWKNVKWEELKNNGGLTLLSRYKSIKNMLCILYPDVNWKYIVPSLFKDYYKNIDNRRKFLLNIKEKLNLKELDDLLSVDRKTIIKFKGGYNYLNSDSSYYNILKSAFPEHDWNVSPGKKVPRNYLQCIDNQRKLIDKIGKEKFNINELDDWCYITSVEFRKEGGTSILQQYPSYIEMLKIIYPNHKWDFTATKKLKLRNYWNDFENVKKAMKKVELAYHIKDPFDWYRISIPMIIKQTGAGIFGQYKLYDILCKLYPDINWNIDYLTRKDKRAKQRWLSLCITQLFPNEEVIEEFRFGKNQFERLSGKEIEIDVYVPRFRLAFEYNGEHHYKEVPAFGAMEMYKERDNEKFKLCKENNIILISIPYWWDCEISSLCDYINTVHPSILHQIELYSKKILNLKKE